MADHLVRSKTVYQASGTSLVATFTETPALDNTHLLVAVVQVASATVVAAPSGWTEVSGGGNSSTNQVRMFVKQGDSSTNSVTFTVASTSATATIAAFSGYISLTPLWSSGGNGASATSSTVNVPSGYTYGVALAAVGTSSTVTWGSWTTATRTGTIANASQRLDFGRVEYTGSAMTGTISWTTARSTRILGAILPLTAAPDITTTTLNAMTTNSAFSQTLAATANPAPTWSVTAGSLPSGLSLSSGGVLSGTPTTTGSYNFTVTATNSGGSDTQNYTGSVAQLVLPEVFAAYNFSEGTGSSTADASGNGYSLTATGSPWTTSGKTTGGYAPTASNYFTRANFGTQRQTTTWTVMFWFKRTSTLSSGYGQFLFDGHDMWFEIDSSNFAYFGDSTFGTIPLDTWVHMTIVQDGTVRSSYLNGVYQNSDTTHTWGFEMSSTYTFGIGGDGPIPGLMDDFRLFEVALTQPQIAAYMDIPVTDTSGQSRALSYIDTAWNTPGTGSGDGATLFKEVTVVDCKIGDIILAFGATESYANNSGPPRYILDSTVGGVKTGTWTNITGVNPDYYNDIDFYAGYAAVTAPGSITVQVGLRGSESMGVGAYLIPSSMIAGSYGFVGSGMVSDTDGMLSVTLGDSHSLVISMGGDWTANSMGTTTTPSDGVVYRSQVTNGAYSSWTAAWLNQSPGTRNYGPSGLSSHDITGGVFALSATAPSAQWFTGSGTALIPYTLTGSGLVQLQ
ncbi:MAG: LamG-like jellyroll fold domain-containing protein [Candidatus Microsaccharimonas sp.]